MIYSHGNGCDLGQMSEAVDAYSSYFVVSLVHITAAASLILVSQDERFSD